MSAKGCAHLQRVDQNIKAKTPNGCDSSPNKHGTKHSKSTGHPTIKSYELGEDWKWCYIDQRFMK